MAVAMLPGATAQLISGLEERGITPGDFLRLSDGDRVGLLGMRAGCGLCTFDPREALERARREMDFMTRHSVRPLLCNTDAYPYRLKECPDAPAVLYTVGNGSFADGHYVGIVGTRKPTPYGTRICRDLVESWSRLVPDLQTVSGLAYGIDCTAHTASLEFGIGTIAVMAHGLDMIYPAAHRDIARRIACNGGLIVSEYPTGVKPFRNNFLARNRIIAALSDAVTVVESGYRGGALSTATHAFDMNREVFAVPGRIGDEMSLGCNTLIRKEKAHILVSPDTLIEEMRWDNIQAGRQPVQRNLFPALSPEQKKICDFMKQKEGPVTLDAIHYGCGLPISEVMSLLTDLEADGIVDRHPGNRYSLC